MRDAKTLLAIAGGAGDARCKDFAGDSGGLAGRDAMSMLTMIAAEGGETKFYACDS